MIPLFVGLVFVVLILMAREAMGKEGKEKESVPELTEIQGLIYHAARAHDVDPAMALAIAEKENASFDANAVNPSDPSYGLGQIQAFWVPYFELGTLATAPRQLLDAGFNADVLARILHYFFYEKRGFTFPGEADVYNVGETLWRKGVRNTRYRDQAAALFEKWKGLL